jgi:drug/metabolite transporter (DMT)-like permease
MPRPRFTPLDLILYAAVIFAWGFSWIAMHYQVGVVEPEISVVWRFLLAAPIRLPLDNASRSRPGGRARRERSGAARPASSLTESLECASQSP